MPSYIVTSDSPITAKGMPGLPDRPDWEVGGGPILPEGRPGDILPPDIRRELRRRIEEARDSLPPPEEWPELPPDWRDHLPVLPDWGRPSVPLPPDPEVLPPGGIWPPTHLPDLPDVSGKTLALVRVYVSRRVNFLAWTVIDHAAVKEAFEKAVAAVKDKLPAGGVGGRPPNVRPPG